MNREIRRAEDRRAGHWSRDPTFAVNTRVRLKPTGPGPIDPADLEPIERLLGTGFELTPELLEELRALGVGIERWVSQDPSRLQTFLGDPKAGIEGAIAAGLATPISAELQECFERAARAAKPRTPRATAEYETTVVPFTEEGDDRPS